MKAYIKLIGGSQIARKKSNSNIRSINGKIVASNTLKILSQNKNGDALFQKIHDIKELIKKHKPHIAVITELNLSNKSHDGLTELNCYHFDKR